MKTETSILKDLKASFPRTIPILLGYLFLGMAFGILLTDKGYHWLWAVFMGLIIYAGMGQFVAVNMLLPGVNFLNAFLLQLTLNARHMFYGLSMLGKFKMMGKRKPYMIFALTDETYSLLCSAKVPADINEKNYYFFIALLDHSYWIIGCALGGLIGSLLTFDTTGIDFVMTALFITIAVDQWRETKNHIPVFSGFVCSLFCLLLFGAEHFIIPSLLCITVGLLILRKPIEAKNAKEAKEKAAMKEVDTDAF
jgi:4-azaleucine resistance transporter AzlC